MSIRRLMGTTAAMTAAAAGLRAVTPDLGAVAAVAWSVWLWGALGLILTALSALPGFAGTLAGALTECLLPAGARRTAALALGVGLVTGSPLLTGCAVPPGAPPPTVAVAAAQGPAAPPSGPVAD